MSYPFGAVVFRDKIVISDGDKLRVRGLSLGLLGRFQLYSKDDTLLLNGVSDFYYFQGNSL